MGGELRAQGQGPPRTWDIASTVQPSAVAMVTCLASNPGTSGQLCWCERWPRPGEAVGAVGWGHQGAQALLLQGGTAVGGFTCDAAPYGIGLPSPESAAGLQGLSQQAIFPGGAGRKRSFISYSVCFLWLQPLPGGRSG